MEKASGPNTSAFTPQRHDIGGAEPTAGLGNVSGHENALFFLEKEPFAEVSQRRASAAGLVSLGWRERPQLSEHLAWLLEHETDALTVCSLYQAVLATHPESWTLLDWQRRLLETTPFSLLKTVVVDGLLSEGLLHVDTAEGQALIKTLDPSQVDHRALLTEHLWLIGQTDGRTTDEVVALLRPDAPMADKVAGVRIVRFSNDEHINEQALPALYDLFRAERHAGLSLKIGQTLVHKRGYSVDLDMAAFFIRAFYDDGAPAASNALASIFFSVESFLLDDCFQDKRPPSAVSAALLSRFSPSALPAAGAAVANALAALSIDPSNSLVAFASTAALQASGHDSTEGARLVVVTAKAGEDPVARALAIRVLAEKPRALLPLLNDLKALVVATQTDPRVRRAASHALVNSRRSGLPVRMPEVIDLHFRYLTQAPFDHFADALHSSDISDQARHFLKRFAQNIDAIGSEEARRSAFYLMSNSFSFGLDEAFEPHWPQVVGLMLRALDEPGHGELHYMIFWNMLNDVVIPEPAASVFERGLKDRLKTVPFENRSRELIEGWLGKRRR